MALILPGACKCSAVQCVMFDSRVAVQIHYFSVRVADSECDSPINQFDLFAVQSRV